MKLKHHMTNILNKSNVQLLTYVVGQLPFANYLINHVKFWTISLHIAVEDSWRQQTKRYQVYIIKENHLFTEKAEMHQCDIHPNKPCHENLQAYAQDGQEHANADSDRGHLKNMGMGWENKLQAREGRVCQKQDKQKATIIHLSPGIDLDPS